MSGSVGGQFSASESFANGWSNPYRYDGRALRLYDPETQLYLDSGRAYDPVLGRELSNVGLGVGDGGYIADGNNPITIGSVQGPAPTGGMPADAGGSSPSPYGVCTYNCGRGGGNRQIVLNGATWRERDAEQPTIAGRLKFAQQFGAQYSSHGDDWNRAEEGFMSYLLAAKADRMAKSPYWGGVDGLLIDTMFDAAWRLQHGLGYPPQRPVRWWMHYIRHPSNYWFWLAHNDSINEDTFDAWSPGRRWYDSENHLERAFTNDAVLVLYATGYIEIGASAALASPFSAIGLKLIALFFVHKLGSQTTVVRGLTGQHYPKRYPTESTWFKTKLGRAYSAAGCLWRVFPDAPCVFG